MDVFQMSNKVMTIPSDQISETTDIPHFSNIRHWAPPSSLLIQYNTSQIVQSLTVTL